MLKVENLWVKRGAVTVLEDVSFSLEAGKTLAVVGESGVGKSTLIAAILNLVPIHRGSVTWAGAPVRASGASLVMQEPRSAFNPVMPLRRSVMEPLIARGEKPSTEWLGRLCKGLEIQPELLDRHPGEVSIGQAQRVGILRALISSPPLVLFDEPLSALDAVTQKHTAQLIAGLQASEGFAALIVTHDLGYAAAYSDRIAVLEAGRIAEMKSSTDFIAAPASAYGQKMRDAAIALGGLGAPA